MSETIEPPKVWSALRPVVLVGAAIVFVFVTVGLGWGGLAPIAGAAIANGVVSPDGRRRTVQHLEGGIIRQILVTAGAHVEAGDPLIVLEETQALAAHERILSQQRTYGAMEARLEAEQRLDEELVFPDWLASQNSNPAATEIIETQRTLFSARRRAQETRASILQQRVAQLDEEITGMEAQSVSQRRQLELIASELEDVQQLYDQGNALRTRLLSLQRQEADISGNLGANLAAISRSRQAIGEAELQIINLEADRLDEIANELNQVRFEQASIEQELMRTQDILSRTSITAPISGIVVQSRFFTIGGVIRPGEPVLDIVPQEEELLIDAQVSPIDIDNVEVGMKAQVILSAYSQRRLPRIEGRVRSISADTLMNEATGMTYFLARVEVDPAQLEGLEGGVILSPGMPAEVFILTGERTAIEYLLEPFIQSFRRAFREA